MENWRRGPVREDCSTGIDGFDVRGEGIPSSGASGPKGENL